MSEYNEISKEREAYLKQRKKQTCFVHFMRISLLFFILMLWELTANFGIIDPFIVSSPSRIIATFTELIESGELFRHLGVSCFETVIGFILSTVLGTLISALLWWNDGLYKIIDPFLVMLNSLPKTALGPLFIVWAGAGTKAIIAVTISVSIVVTILEVLTGFCLTDKNEIKLLKAFGATKTQIFLKSVLPSNYKTIMNSLKVNVGLSWVGVIVGEFLVSKAGIGYLIVYGSSVFKMDLVLTSVILLAITATIMYQLVKCAGKLLYNK